MHRHIAIWLGLSVLLSFSAAQAAPQVAETAGDDPLARSLGQVRNKASGAVQALRVAVGSTVGELKNTVARSAWRSSMDRSAISFSSWSTSVAAASERVISRIFWRSPDRVVWSSGDMIVNVLSHFNAGSTRPIRTGRQFPSSCWARDR